MVTNFHRFRFLLNLFGGRCSKEHGQFVRKNQNAGRDENES